MDFVSRPQRVNYGKFVVLSTLCFVLSLSTSGQQQDGKTVHLYDNSDWWSISRGVDSVEDEESDEGRCARSGDPTNPRH